ncbi:MAG: methionine--tRNA ligase [Acidobacteriota bacterium]|nr:MAG: methionine--tRNA ligase [Acidobacteriota bacterium]
MMKFYVTTPLYYVNDEPHIGHTYSTVVADVVARTKRLRGFDVHFLTGTDEHGQKIERAAAAQNLEPIELADKVVEKYHALWKILRISHDDFIRTTEERHRKGVYALFEKIHANGRDDIFLDDYEGWYCTSCETFWLESQLGEGGACPNPECGRPAEKTTERTYFFRLSAYQEALLEHFKAHPSFIRPEHRRQEIFRFVESGLRDLSISRTTVRWGIPAPRAEGHTLYVWFDALINYISAVGYGDDDEEFSRWWPADLHLIGKDILRFHAVYWPAFLMAAGVEPPKEIFGHGWWLRDEGKMSKTRGNIVRPYHILNDFGPDALRYFLLREMVFGEDANFSDEAFLHRLNSDVANDLGNLLSRTAKLIEGLPAAEGRPGGALSSSDASPALRGAAEKAARAFFDSFDAYRFSDGLRALWALVAEVNRYIDASAPWQLSKDSSKRAQLEKILSDAAEALRIAAVLLSPVAPGYAEEILKQLGVPAKAEALREADASWGARLVGAKAKKGKALFQRTDLKTYLEAEMTEEKKDSQTSASMVGIEDFAGMEILVAQVLEAEGIPKSKKLLRVVADLGSEKRQLVAGVAERYKPEELVGRRILVLANLQPAKLMGVESQGMLLAAETPDGDVSVVWGPEDVPLGSKVR